MDKMCCHHHVCHTYVNAYVTYVAYDSMSLGRQHGWEKKEWGDNLSYVYYKSTDLVDKKREMFLLIRLQYSD